MEKLLLFQLFLLIVLENEFFCRPVVWVDDVSLSFDANLFGWYDFFDTELIFLVGNVWR